MKTKEETPEADGTAPGGSRGWRVPVLAGLAILVAMSALIAGLFLYFQKADAPPDDLCRPSRPAMARTAAARRSSW